MPLTRLQPYSEPYGPTGNIGDNVLKLIGTPSLDRLQTVVREAVQNIADAAKLGLGPEILIRLRRLTPGQRTLLASQVICGHLKDSRSNTLLTTMRMQRDPVVMDICDFNTTGLGGPTRSDRIPVGTTTTDFIDFLRNVGTERDTKQGGGTYGFGKVSLYGASRCRTIIVDTLPTGPEGRRLMGCHLGKSFEVREGGMSRRYTGRHWWGAPDPADEIVDPVTGSRASEVARWLGLPERSVGQTGTSIMILDFETDEKDLNDIGNRVVENLLWNFWPRMMTDTPADRRFKCQVEVNGSSLPIPSPEELPPLNLFAKAMRAVRAGSGNDVRPISSMRPAKRLGTLAMEKGLRARRGPLVQEDSLFPETSSHIALMRPVELVVRYLKGNPLPNDRLEWAGVFVTSNEDEVESAFAESEPPAHDDWKPQYLPRGNRKRYVNIALTRLRDAASQMGLEDPKFGGDPGPPLGRLARRLGQVLERVVGGPEDRPRPPPGSNRTRPKRARATRPVFECLESAANGSVAVFSTEVRQDAGRTGFSLSVHPLVVMEGSGVASRDGDIPQPHVVSIRSRDGRLGTSGRRLQLNGAEGRFEIRVVVPQDCAVTVKANVLVEGSER